MVMTLYRGDGSFRVGPIHLRSAKRPYPEGGPHHTEVLGFRYPRPIMVHAIVAASLGADRGRGPCAEYVCGHRFPRRDGSSISGVGDSISTAPARRIPRGPQSFSKLEPATFLSIGAWFSRSLRRSLASALTTAPARAGATSDRVLARCASRFGGARLLEKAGEKPPFVLVGHSYGGWLARLFAETYPADVSGMVLVDAGAEDPLRGVDGKVTHASELAKGQPVPPVKTSDPLRESEIPPRISA